MKPIVKTISCEKHLFLFSLDSHPISDTKKKPKDILKEL